MGRRIVVAGAGGFGRGVLAWIEGSTQHRREHNVRTVVFIDDGTPQHALRARVVSTIDDYEPLPGDVVICAIGDPATRRRVVSALSSRGAQFHTFIDDRAVLASDVRIGAGAVVCPGVVISAGVTVGAHAHVNFNSSIGHDAVLGDYVTLSPSVNIMGEVLVGDDVFFGGGSTVLPRLSIGDQAVVGAGATVVHSLGRALVVVGNPARPIVRGSGG